MSENANNLRDLLRFIYLGNVTFDCVFISKRKKVSFHNIDQRLGFISHMVVEGRVNFPLTVIRRAIEKKLLPRNDEAILVLAYCVRRIDGQFKDELRNLVYASLSDFVLNEKDFLLFIHYSHELNKTDERTAKGFGRGMRKAVTKWYTNRSPIEFANMIGRNRGLYNWTHKDIINLCHVKFGDNSDFSRIIKAIHDRGTRLIEEIQNDTENTEPLTEGINRLNKLFELKVCESPKDAAALIQLHKFTIDQLPAHLYESPEVWAILIPTLSYMQLLQIFPTLHDLTLLKPEDILSKIMSAALGNQNLMHASKVHPLDIVAVQRGYEKSKRYNEYIKNEWYQKKKIVKRAIAPNKALLNQLGISLNHTFSCAPISGARCFITVDLRTSNLRRKVFGTNELNCLDASVIMAMALMKREKGSRLYSFTENNKYLKLINIKQDNNYEQTLKVFMQELVPRTMQSLSLPIKCAANEKFDVFITFVDSVARFCRQGNVPIQEFVNYRAQKNNHAKYIVVSLACHKPILNFSGAKGCLEICGISPDTPKIIQAFLSNSFY